MEQLNMFELDKEVVLIPNLKLSGRLKSSIVKKHNKVFIKQVTINEIFMNKDHWLYIPPSYSEICKECLKKGVVTDSDEYGRCYNTIGVINLDKLIQFCARSIIQIVAGNKDLSRQYEELAMEEYEKGRSIATVEEHVPRAVKRKLYEMVS